MSRAFERSVSIPPGRAFRRGGSRGSGGCDGRRGRALAREAGEKRERRRHDENS